MARGRASTGPGPTRVQLSRAVLHRSDLLESGVRAHRPRDRSIANATAVGAGKALVLTPKGGARNGLVQALGTATAPAEQIRNVVRSRLEPETTQILLHLATPAGLALLLGHRWNRMRPTMPYEYTPDGYIRTFQIPA